MKARARLAAPGQESSATEIRSAFASSVPAPPTRMKTVESRKGRTTQVTMQWWVHVPAGSCLYFCSILVWSLRFALRAGQTQHGPARERRPETYATKCLLIFHTSIHQFTSGTRVHSPCPQHHRTASRTRPSEGGPATARSLALRPPHPRPPRPASRTSRPPSRSQKTGSSH